MTIEEKQELLHNMLETSWAVPFNEINEGLLNAWKEVRRKVYEQD